VSATPAEKFLQAITDLEAIQDPKEQAMRGHELQLAMKAAPARIRAITDAAVATLRQSMSGNEVAELLGVTKGRVSQMTNGRPYRKPPSTLYAARRAGEDSWHGDPEALPPGEYQTATVNFDPTPTNSWAGQLEVRYGPVQDDMPPSLHAYTLVAGRPMRATAKLHEILFGDGE
jgi:predicted XRE-type DNA-binding protein